MAAKDDDLDLQDDADIDDADIDGSSPSSGGDDDDIKYQIGTIVVDDGSADDYTEVEEDFAAPATGTATPAVEEDTIDDDEVGSQKDEFLDEANVDLDDPERYWDS